MGKSAAKKKSIRWGRYVLLVLLLLGVYHILSGSTGILNLLKMHQTKLQHAKETDSLEARKRELEKEKGRWRDDSAYWELTARKDLNMAKPNEKVFRFMGPEKSGKGEQEEK